VARCLSQKELGGKVVRAGCGLNDLVRGENNTRARRDHSTKIRTRALRKKLCLKATLEELSTTEKLRDKKQGPNASAQITDWADLYRPIRDKRRNW